MLSPYPTGVWNLKMTVFAISYSPYHPLCFLSLSSGRGNICSLRYEIVSCYTTPRTVKLTGPPLRTCCELETWTEISPEESGHFLDYTFWGMGAGRRPWIKERRRTLRQLLGRRGLTYWEVNGYFLPASQKVRISAAPRIHCAPNAF